MLSIPPAATTNVSASMRASPPTRLRHRSATARPDAPSVSICVQVNPWTSLIRLFALRSAR